ncbi:amino acid transporter [Choiromyces venosus 120613-1]|uniref:Amino acid transporter n=1 Tax=Choiromyces venosus 120613-1 TaxID=1336337 RepID=A0A3N4J628_9PEZI|nr:amino acid transporter [Choiromyces venosus 120613-1]
MAQEKPMSEAYNGKGDEIAVDVGQSTELLDDNFGRKQELERNFSIWSLIGAAFIGVPTWSVIVISLNLGIYQGGPALIIYGPISVAPFSLLISLSLAELASMFPTTGGPQEWSYRLGGRPGVFWSWLTAWANLVGWAIGLPLVGIATSLSITGLAVLYNPNYSPKTWHIFLIGEGCIAVGAIINIYGRKLVPLIDHIGFYWYFIVLLILVIVPISTADTKATPEFVFKTFINSTGWSSDFVCYMTGLNFIAAAFIGIDSVTHLAEEVPRPSVNLPRAIILAPIVGFIATFTMLVCIMFSIPADSFESILTSPIGYPLIQIVLNATESRTASLIITLLVLYISVQNIMNCCQISSRVIWSFARDGGFIFPKFFREVHPTLAAPVRAIYAVWAIGTVLMLLFLGCTSAFNALTSAFVIMFHITYCIPIVIFLLRRRTSPFTTGFPLGKFGFAINTIAVAYMMFTSVMFFLPGFMPVDGLNMNYAFGIVGVTAIIALTSWFITGRENYLQDGAGVVISL